MGAWSSVRDYIQWTLDNLGVKKKLDYIGRKAAASPATGYANRHAKQQKEILDKVFKQMSEKIVVPVLGESITEATVAKWLKSKGAVSYTHLRAHET